LGLLGALQLPPDVNFHGVDGSQELMSNQTLSTNSDKIIFSDSGQNGQPLFEGHQGNITMHNQHHWESEFYGKHHNAQPTPLKPLLDSEFYKRLKVFGVLFTAMLANAKPFQNFREMTKNVVFEASHKGLSPFERWTSDSLKCLLITHNIQVRGSKQASHRTLARICDELFENEYQVNEEDFVRVYTMEKMLLMDKSASSIQWCYIEYRQRQKRPRSLNNLVVDILVGIGEESEHYIHPSSDRNQDMYNIDRERGQKFQREDASGSERGTFYDEFDDVDQGDRIMEINTHYNEIEGQESNELYYLERDNHHTKNDDGERISLSSSKSDDKIRRSLDEEQLYQNQEYVTNSACDQEGGETREVNNNNNSNKDTALNRKKLRAEMSLPEDCLPEHTENTDVVVKTPRSNNFNRGKRASEDTDKTKRLDEELDTVWTKPSWKVAKEFEAENRPHRSGKSMNPYDYRTLTTGRHCMVGGCGEQLDLWNEGQMSELAQFGSGVTNYFKVRLPCHINLHFRAINSVQFNSTQPNHSFKSGAAGQCSFLP
jgi:hypothetical protein